jgi:putative ABC transport system permease protein
MNMASTLVKKSWGDLKKRKSRTFFTILTIAISVAAMGLFAVIPLINEGMSSEIDECNMYDVSVKVNKLKLNDSDIEQIENIDNINAVEGRYEFFTRMYIGERRNDAVIIGIDDFRDQKIDIVSLDSGSYPGDLEVLTDTGNSRADLYNRGEGAVIKIYDVRGEIQELKITGSGSSIRYDYPAGGVAVFYANIDTVYSLSNGSGYTSLNLDLDKASEETAKVAINELEVFLSENTEFKAFIELPNYREDGSWPGKEEFESMSSFFSILTFITVFCSFFLISNTMHTIISEQKKEIAQMKAVGATRGQIVRSYLTTSFLMGGIGSVIGSVIGIFIGYFMASYFATTFWGFELGFGVHIDTIILGALVGLGITILASIPSLVKTLKVTVREGLEGGNVNASYGNSKIDRALIKNKWFPRSMQMGIRNVSRKKGRSISTIIQVALAVGILLSVLGIGYSLGIGISGEFDNFTYDIMITGQVENGKPLTEDLEPFLEDIEGVSNAEPFLGIDLEYDEYNLMCFGYNYDTVSYNYKDTMYRGRWFTQEEQKSNASVIVVSKTFARINDIDVGDIINLKMATGFQEFEVIGTNKGQMNNGMVAYAPISTLQDKMVWGELVIGYTIITDSGDHGLIDRTATTIEDEMLENGYIVNVEIMYVLEELNQQSVNMIINLMLAVGSLVVLITMIGLMSTLTMNIFDRTKEIGMMRCIGSRAGHIRWIFGIEGLIMAVIGWAIGIPLGYALGEFINYQIYDLMNIDMVFYYPMEYILLSFILTILLTLVIVQPSLWKATHLKPGDALRYQ